MHPDLKYNYVSIFVIILMFQRKQFSINFWFSINNKNSFQIKSEMSEIFKE